MTERFESKDGPPPRIPDLELVSRIAAGSYGEVWLARLITGALRAVKVIRRSNFSSARPFEREFNGVKHAEPVSRTHPGLLDILHVARDDEAGFFHYVMELADDRLTGREINPLQYKPRTLSSDLRDKGRLTVRQCLEIGYALADALHHLHSNDLLHRDIKPSNVIFLDGKPLLADIGLVTPIAEAHSIVGTDGFRSPESPTTPQSDIYSLGKVLYELSMGRDREEFPELPTRVDDGPEGDALLELNELLLKACDPVPKNRHASAAELRDEIKLLLDGRSLIELYAAQRRRRRWRLAAAIVLPVALAVVSWLAFRSPLHVLLHADHPALTIGQPRFGDVNGDGKTDLVILSGGLEAAYTLQGLRLDPRARPAAPGLHECLRTADADADGADDIFSFGRDGQDLFIRIINISGYEKARFVAPLERIHHPLDGWVTNTINFLRLLPGTNATHRRLFAEVSAGRGPLRRYVCLFDFHNHRPQPRVEPTWIHPIAGLIPDEDLTKPSPVALFDVNGDGQPDLLFGTAAVGNGYLIGNTADTNSYVHALDAATGRELWRAHTGHRYARSHVRMASLDGSGSNHMLVVMVKRAQEDFLPKASPTENAVLLLSPADGSVRAVYRAGAPIMSWHFASLGRDGREEILLTDRLARFHIVQVRDGRLECRQLVQLAHPRFNASHPIISGVADLDGDGHPEIVVRLHFDEDRRNADNAGFTHTNPLVRYLHEPQILVLDSSLRITARRKVATLWEADPGFRTVLADFLGTGRPQILVIEGTSFRLLGYRR